MEASAEVKKKRGRRPKSEKVVQGVDVVPPDASHDKTVDSCTTDNIVDEQASSKGRRGRKPKYVYNAYEMAAQTNNTTLSDDENVIVKLNIQQTPSLGAEIEPSLSLDETLYQACNVLICFLALP